MNLSNGRWLAGSIILLVLNLVLLFTVQSFLVLCIPVAILYILFVIADWKKAWWLLMFCIPLSIQFTLSGKAFSLSLPDEPMCWLFLLVTFLLLAHNPGIIPRWWWNNPLVLVIALQLFWLVVAVAFSTVPMLSLKFLAAKVWYLACFFVLPVLVVRDKADFRKAFLLFLIPVVATSVIILYRLLTHHFRFAAIGVSVGKLYINHVEYAAVLSIFYPLIWVAWPLTKRSGTWKRLALFLALLFFIPALFFTYARVVVPALAFAIVVGVAIKYRLVNFIMPLIYATVIIAFLWLLKDNRYLDLHPDINHTVMHHDYNSHLESTFQGKDVSFMERVYRWVAAIRMSTDRPLVGYGPHGFVPNYKRYALNMFRTFVSNNKEHSTTHNYFLYMLAEQGWPAMLLYALLLVVVLAQAQKTYHRLKDPFYKYCMLGLAMAFASSFVNNFVSELIETHKAGAMFYIIIALLMILRQKSLEQATAPNNH